MKMIPSTESLSKKQVAQQAPATDLDEILSIDSRSSGISSDTIAGADNLNIHIHPMEMTRGQSLEKRSSEVEPDSPSKISQYSKRMSKRGSFAVPKLDGSPMLRRGTTKFYPDNASTKSLVKKPVAFASLTLSKASRSPSLPEKMALVDKWFASCCEEN